MAESLGALNADFLRAMAHPARIRIVKLLGPPAVDAS